MPRFFSHDHKQRLFKLPKSDGIPALEPERAYDWDPVEQAEKLLYASGAKIEHTQNGGAYYRLSRIRFDCRRRIGL
jgi:antirestriction protein ArdC